jgi:hypothetical protein
MAYPIFVIFYRRIPISWNELARSRELFAKWNENGQTKALQWWIVSWLCWQDSLALYFNLLVNLACSMNTSYTAQVRISHKNHVSLYWYSCLFPGTPERREGKGGRFSWKGTFGLIYTKRCLQNNGSWVVLRQAIVLFLKLDDCISCVFWSKFVKESH